MQVKQQEWSEQWSIFRDEELFLFLEWIYPNTLENFKGKDVLECGCGGGQHTSFIAPYARNIVAVDLNTIDIAKDRNKEFGNIEFVEADIAEMDLKREFDVVFCIGVVHHTNSPDETVRNLMKHLKIDGKIILWVYSKEGNYLVRNVVEPIRKCFLMNIDRRKLLAISKFITMLLYIPVFSVYKLPFAFLPYYDYFGNFRKLSYDRNVLNVYDKLNAPQVQFMSRDRVLSWFNDREFVDVHISSYKKVSWRASGTKRPLT